MPLSDAQPHKLPAPPPIVRPAESASQQLTDLFFPTSLRFFRSTVPHAPVSAPSQPAQPVENPYAKTIPDTPEMRKLIEILRGGGKGDDLAKREGDYAKLVDRQTIENLYKLYKADQEGRTKIFIAGFATEGERAPDGGYSPVLRVVKRYDEPLKNGKTLTIYVNEHWHAALSDDRVSGTEEGALFLPDEIRIHYIVFDGQRTVPGSEKLHAFDRLRVAWDAQGKPLLFRQALFDKLNPETGETSRLQTRTPISAPRSCVTCHSSGNKFTESFKRADESAVAFRMRVNNEAIVPDLEFERPMKDQLGYRQYLQALEKAGAKEAFVERVKASLANPGKSLAVPHIVELLEQKVAQRESTQWIGPDYPLSRHDQAYYSNTPAKYTGKNGELYIESIEEQLRMQELLGIGLWWHQGTVFPLPADDPKKEK